MATIKESKLLDVLKLVLEKSDDIIAYRDREFKLVFFNTEFEKTFKKHFNIVPFVGMNTLDYHPEETKSFWQPIVEQVLSGEKYRNEFSWDFGNSDICHYDISFIPIYIDGEVVGCAEFNRDITERKKAEKSLVDSNAKLEEMNQIMKAVFDHTHIMAVLLDTNFNFLWVNHSYADTCCHEPSFFPGKNHFDLYPHEENEAIFKRVVDAGEPFFIEGKPFGFPDQPERGVTYWDWSLIPVKDSGKVTSLVFTLLEVTERKRAEDGLKKAHGELEQRVKERTLELQEKNVALKVLLTQRENDKKDLEQNILSNINALIQPYIKDLKRNNANSVQVAYLNLIESNLEDIVSPFSKKLSSSYMKFTSREIEIANLIKEGKKDKEIMEIMNIAYETVKGYRKNIRKKLGIHGKGTSLRNKLLSM